MPTASITHHLTLTVGNTTRGLMVRSYVEPDVSSFAPKIASGDLKYGDLSIYQTLSQVDFSHGFGFRESTDAAGYAFSDSGIDSRMGHSLTLATKMTEAGWGGPTVAVTAMAYTLKVVTLTAVSAFEQGDHITVAGVNAGFTVTNIDGEWICGAGTNATTVVFTVTSQPVGTTPQTISVGTITKDVTPRPVVKCIEYSGSVYVCTESGVYKWNQSTGKIESTGQDTGIVLDAINNGLHLMVTLYEEPAIFYDGLSWSTFAQEPTDIQWLCMSGKFIWTNDRQLDLIHYSGDPVNGMEGGDADPGHIHVGPGAVPINGLVAFQNALYIGREDGLWYMPNDVSVKDTYMALSYMSERHAFNFEAMAVWQGALYFSIKNNLIRFVGSTIKDVSPPAYDFSWPYKRYGHFRFLTPAGPYLYVIADENYGSNLFGAESFGWGTFGGGAAKQVLLCYDGVGWHKLWELSAGADSVSGLSWTPTNNKLWIGIRKSDDAHEAWYIPFRDYSEIPYADYETTTSAPSDSDHPHYIYTSRFDAGMATIDKHFSKLAIKGSKGPMVPIDVAYQLDSWKPWISLATYESTKLDIEEHDFPTGIVGKTISFRLNMQTESSGSTPVIEAVILRYLPHPPVIWSWTFDVWVADNIQTLDGRRESATGFDLYKFIKKARSTATPLTFTDRYGVSHYVYMTSCRWLPQRQEPGADGHPTSDASGTPRELEGYYTITLASAQDEDEIWQAL